MKTTEQGEWKTIREAIGKMRAYFGEHDKTPHDHMLFSMATHARESLDRLQAKRQSVDVERIMEVIGTWFDWYADQPIKDGPLAAYEEAGYVISKEGHEELRDRLTSALQPVDPWISCKDRLPEPGRKVLVFVQRRGLKDADGELQQHVGHMMHNGSTWIIGNYFSYDMGEPIAWKELGPNPPKPQQP